MVVDGVDGVGVRAADIGFHLQGKSAGLTELPRGLKIGPPQEMQ
jgi:hypothetical protein